MKKDYDYDELFPGRFLKSGEFKGRAATLTIAGVDLEEMEDRKGKRMKAIVSFRETKKQLVLNKTNGECLKGLFGRKVREWVGRRVTFYPATVDAFGAQTLAIRIQGSPDIERDMRIKVKVGRTEGEVLMKRTGQKANGKAAAAPPPPPPEEPPHDPETGELTDDDGPPLDEPPPDYPLPTL